MSKQIMKVEGSFEQSHFPEKQVTIYGDAEMFLTSFFGGDRGRCVQFTIQSGDTAYIQLKRREVAKVMYALKQWLEESN